MFLKSKSQAYLKLEIKKQAKHKANSRPEQILVHKWNEVQENHRRQKQVAGLAKDRKDTTTRQSWAEAITSVLTEIKAQDYSRQLYASKFNNPDWIGTLLEKKNNLLKLISKKTN